MRRDARRVSKGQLTLPLFLESLEPGARTAYPPPPVLLRMAASAAARVPGCTASPEDLVSELILRILERRSRGEPPLGGQVENVAAVLRHRLWQLASEHAPSRKLLKELTAHVRRAIDQAPPARVRRPESLERHGRLQHAEVSRAVAWAVAEQDAPGEPRALARWLAREYGLLAEARPLDEARGLPESGAPAVGALRLARRLAARLGREKVALLRLRLDGATLKEVGEAMGGSTTGAYERMRQMEMALSEEVSALRAPEERLREALRLFARVPLEVAGCAGPGARVRSGSPYTRAE